MRTAGYLACGRGCVGDGEGDTASPMSSEPATIDHHLAQALSIDCEVRGGRAVGVNQFVLDPRSKCSLTDLAPTGFLIGPAGGQKEQADPSSGSFDETVEAESITRVLVNASNSRLLQGVVPDPLLFATVLEHSLQTCNATHAASQTRINFRSMHILAEP